MGCASSSPLVNGGLADSAKTAATELMNTGEKTMNDMGDNLTETAGQVKESVVESINGMANSINNVISDGMTKIPLKDATSNIEEAVDSKNHLIEENLENLKNDMLTKAQSMGDEADKITDELIKDTEDVIRDAETAIVDLKENALEKMETVQGDFMDAIKGNDGFSVDSLGTFAAEPEIEKLLNGEPEKPMSPEATVGELDDLNQMESEELPSMDVAEAPEPMSAEKPIEENLHAMSVDENTATNEAESSTASESESMKKIKREDDLVVEDVKSTDENDNMIGTRLAVVEEVCDASGEDEENSEDEGEEEENPSATRWEEMHDIIFTKPILFSRGINSSVESLMEDEENCALNLSRMYNDETQERSSVQIKIEVDDDKGIENKKQIADNDSTLDVIDDLLKSFEKEMDTGLEAVPIVNAENE